MRYIGKFMIYHHTKFHTLSSSDSLVITIKHKTNYRFHATVMMLVYIRPKKYKT
jgi:hypothetical protein